MIKSMTGFARKDTQQEWGSLVWELRSVNHRYLELSLRLPEDMRVLEAAVRETLTQHLSRGKIECHLRFVRHPGALCDTRLNTVQAEKFIRLHQEAKNLTSDTAQLKAIELLRWPGVVEENETGLDPVRQQALALFEEVLQDLVKHRQREGDSLKQVIEARCEAVMAIVASLRERLPAIRENLRQRLLDRLREIDVEVDQVRLEQELILQLQKMDVDEELDRLEAHVKEVMAVLQRDEPVGRRLDFLMQELNREANTLGSKSVSIDSSGVAVELKVLIEQMREQVQNIE